MGTLKGKTALVTGAASGIGRACAFALAGAGAQLELADVQEMNALLKELSESGIRVRAHQCDVSDEKQVARLFERLESGPDVVVHSAGILREQPLEHTSLEDFDHTLSVNLRGTFLLGRAALPRMRTAGTGSFIAVASELAYPGRAGFSAYCASKAGVIGLVRSWAREFAPAVRVNALAPGPVDTPMLGLEHMSPETLEAETRIPMGRVARPEEIAAVALFLAGSDASFMTGQTVSPNGGAVMF